jgi:hypothetical protein
MDVQTRDQTPYFSLFRKVIKTSNVPCSNLHTVGEKPGLDAPHYAQQDPYQSRTDGRLPCLSYNASSISL